jgi:hypothetical protein
MVSKTKVKPELTAADLVLPVLAPASMEFKMERKRELTVEEPVSLALLVLMVFRMAVKLELTVVDHVL